MLENAAQNAPLDVIRERPLQPALRRLDVYRIRRGDLGVRRLG